MSTRFINQRLAHLTVLAFFLAFTTVLPVGCSTHKNPREPLTILGEDSSNLHAIDTVGTEYARTLHADLRIDAKPFDQAQAAALTALSNNQPTPDIILQYNFSLASYVRHNWVTPIAELRRFLQPADTQALESDLFDNVWRELAFYPDSNSAIPEPVGYPFAANTILLCYSRPFFEADSNRAAFRRLYGRELAPPQTWDDFATIVKFFTNPKHNTYGLVLEGASGGWLYYEWANFAYSMGGGVMRKRYGWEGDEHTPLILTDPSTVKATQFYFGLRPYTINQATYTKTTSTELVGHMKSGSVAMALVWSDYIPDLVASANGKPLYGFAPIPGSLSMIAGGLFYINAHSAHKGLAARFIAGMLLPRVQVSLMKRGLCSPLRSTYTDSSVARLPYSAALKASLDRGVYMAEAGPDADLISSIITEELQRAWLEHGSVAAALTRAQSRLDKERPKAFAAFRADQ